MACDKTLGAECSGPGAGGTVPAGGGKSSSLLIWVAEAPTTDAVADVAAVDGEAETVADYGLEFSGACGTGRDVGDPLELENSWDCDRHQRAYCHQD